MSSIEISDEMPQMLTPDENKVLSNNVKPKYSIGDTKESLFRKYFPNYQNDKPLFISDIFNLELMHMGMSRHSRKLFIKFMRHSDKNIRKKGLALLIK